MKLRDSPIQFSILIQDECLDPFVGTRVWSPNLCLITTNDAVSPSTPVTVLKLEGLGNHSSLVLKGCNVV